MAFLIYSQVIPEMDGYPDSGVARPDSCLCPGDIIFISDLMGNCRLVDSTATSGVSSHRRDSSGG